MLKVIRGRALRCALITSAVLGGTASAAHAAAPNSFAVVSPGGAKLAHANVVGTVKTGVGEYDIKFTHAIDTCAYVATPAKTTPGALIAYTSISPAGADTVHVVLKDQAAAPVPTDGKFSLHVNCGGPNLRFAVVNAAGALDRGTPGATVTALGGGRYEAKFPVSVGSCSYLATVGQPGPAVFPGGANVSTASGPDPFTVYVETKNPGGGLQPNVPFHLSVVCTNATRTRSAVINGTGIFSRGAAGTSSFSLVTGRYQLVSTVAKTSSCAVIGTRGSVNAAVPFIPATVESTIGLAVNTAGFEVRELGAFGGSFVNEAFHAALIC